MNPSLKKEMGNLKMTFRFPFLLIIIISISFTFLCLWNPFIGSAKALEEREWPLLGESLNFRFYYDDADLTQTPGGVITVWVRLVPMTNYGKEKYLEDRKNSGLTLEGYNTFVFDQKLIKLDCFHITFRIVQRMDFGIKKRVLGFHNFSSPWQEIPTRSPAKALFDVLCHQPQQ